MTNCFPHVVHVRLVHRHETHWGSTLEESETRGECSDPSYTTIRVRGRDEREREIERERDQKERERENRKIFVSKNTKRREPRDGDVRFGIE